MEEVVKHDLISAFSGGTTSIEEQTTSSDAGQYVTPQVWAKDASSWRAMNDPDFPMYGGPGGRFVKVKKKCSTFPYCNQGDINALDFYEKPKKKRKSKKRIKKKKKNKLTPLGIRKRKIAKDLVRTQRIKTPRGKHYNIGKRISEDTGYLYYNNLLTVQEVEKAILENTMKNKFRKTGKMLEESVKKHLINEIETHQAQKLYAKLDKQQGKSNAEGLKLAADKIKKFMTDDKGVEMNPPMYRNTKPQDEYVEEINYSSGQTGIKYDQPLSDEQKKRHTDYLEGSITTGNNTGKGVDGQQVANITMTNSEGGANTTGELLKKAAERRMKNRAKGMEMMNNDRRYSPDVQATTSAGKLKENLITIHEHSIDTPEQILTLTPRVYKVDGREFNISNGKETKKVRYESFIGGKKGGTIVILEESNKKGLSEELSRIKNMFSHNTNTRHNKFI